MNSKTISEKQLFCMLFTSRLAALMITGEITLMNFFIQLFLCAFFGVFAALISERKAVGKSFKRTLRLLCLIPALATVYSISDFKENAVVINVSPVLSLALITAAVLYCASLGIQAPARLSGMCALLLTISLLTGILSNIKGADFKNIMELKCSGILPLDVIKCLDIPLLYLRFCEYASGNKKRALALSVVLPFVLAGAVHSACAIVLKQAVDLYHYPVFTLFQLGQIGTYNKIDILFTAPMLTAVFLKLSLFVAREKNESF